jgi:DNA-binding FadR family transcriptional regulator
MAGYKASTVTDEIANVLGREIVGGLYSPGDTIPGEEEVCARFAASRSAAREAVKMLAAKGLVLTRPRRGSRVCPMKDWNFLDPAVLSWLRETASPREVIIELFEMRLAFECEAAALAAERGAKEDLSEIRKAFGRMQVAAHGGGDPVASDAAFHEAILVATRNRLYQPLSALIHVALQFSVPTTNALFGHTVGDLQAHEKVVRAIEARKPERARAAMREMLDDVLHRVRSATVLPGAKAPRTRKTPVAQRR